MSRRIGWLALTISVMAVCAVGYRFVLGDIRENVRAEISEQMALVQSAVKAPREQSRADSGNQEKQQLTSGANEELTKALKNFAVEIAVIQDRLSNLESRYPRSEGEQEVRRVSSDPLTGGPPGTSQHEEDTDRRLEGLQADLISEAKDPVWSPVVTEDIKKALEEFNSANLGMATLVDVDCRTSRCRLVVDTQDATESTGLDLKLMESLGGKFTELSATRAADDSGRMQTTYFLGQGGE